MSAVDAVLTELAGLDRPALALRWESAFGVQAPKSCQATLLRCALAWHEQVLALPQSKGSREVDRAATALRRAASAPLADALSPGTRLLREWQGRTHHVTVVDAGFEYEGRTWRSLSAISRAITGTRWSGPLFFGMRS